MAVRDVVLYPHPALKQVARELVLGVANPHRGQSATGGRPEAKERATPEGERQLIERVAEDLLDTMRAYPRCVGLAAPQLDELVRMIVVDVGEHPKATSSHGLLTLVNPVLVGSSGAEVAREGCLSIPQLTANVRRATQIVLTASTPAGDAVEIDTEGFEARCLLHEIDHLDGILFLDRVDSLARDVFRRKTYR
jgi:peptide deformylase